MRIGLNRRALLQASAAAMAGAATGARADSYPTRPVRMIVPVAPASGVDILARKLGEQLGQSLGQQIIVDNKPGAGGVIGTGELVRAPADGYTLGMISSNHVVNPGIIKSIPFDSLRDITPISVVATVPLALVVHPSLAAKSVADLIAMAKARPGTLDYGSAGTGTVIHLSGVLFEREAGIQMKHVPYRGTGPLINDLVAGHIKIGFSAASAVQTQIESGNLRALAISTPTRAASLPDVPTMAEAGLANYSFDAWIAMIGPKGLPQSMVDRLYRDVSRALASERMKADLAAQAMTPVGMDPAASAAFFASELEKHQKLVAISGAKSE